MTRCLKIILFALILLNFSYAGEPDSHQNVLLNDGGIIKGKVTDEQATKFRLICKIISNRSRNESRGSRPVL